MCITLVGMPGSGKSTLGLLLARRLGTRFSDTDSEIERRSGLSVQRIFEVEGEAAFRERESSALADLIDRASGVIATGGGVVLSPANRSLLKARSTCVYINVPLAALAERLAADSTRPLLQGRNLEESLNDLLLARRSLYESASHFTVFGAGGSADHVLQRLVDLLPPALLNSARA